MMRSGFLRVWKELDREVWTPMETPHDELTQVHAALLADHSLADDFEAHPDVFGGLYREAHAAMKEELRLDMFDERGNVVRRALDVAEIASRPGVADEFRAIAAEDFDSEGALVDFLERAYDVIAEYDDVLAVRYRLLLEAFVPKYGLHYDLLDPCQIFPTVPGAFASLFRELDQFSGTEVSLKASMDDFKRAYRDIRRDPSDSRIRMCIHTLIVLVEAVSLRHDDVNGKTLGEACGQLQTWPHITIKQSLSKLYGFSSDYPGIRHAGNTEAKNRDLDPRDLIALCVILAGYTPYLLKDINCGALYLPESKP